jgi:ketosteroid isomerase-like protein
MIDDELRLAVERRLDEAAIIQTLDQYSYCSDFNDANGLVDCFVEDAEWWSAIGLTMRGRAEIARWVTEVRNPRNVFTENPDQGRMNGQHFRTNTEISLHGDEADTVSYFVQLAPQGPHVGIMVIGRYIDKFVRCDDGRWRYKRHRTEVEAYNPDLHSAPQRRPDAPDIRNSPYPSFAE